MTNLDGPITNSIPAVPLARSRDGSRFLYPMAASGGAFGATPAGVRGSISTGDKQPMQLSLSYTMADLDDILPPGSYKLDLVDRAGTPLGLTVDVGSGRFATQACLSHRISKTVRLH